MKTLIKNGTLLLDGKRKVEHGYVFIEDGKIKGIYKDDPCLKADEEIDASGKYVIPGFLDMHTHGALGHDFNVCSMDKIQEVADAYVKEGVTGFMASTVSESHEEMLHILKEFESCDCRNMIGVHLEGPYLNINKKAVMKGETLRNPNMEEFHTYLQTCSKIKSMTIAPELPGAHALIMDAVNRGITINIGHSDATCEETLLAEQYGASGITHLYNAMTQHEHRAPGMVTGAFVSNLYCELIVDGFHVHPDVVKATYATIGKERIVLITDANPCKGLPDGQYAFSGKHVIIDHGYATVKETGRIAGSTLQMVDAGRNMMKYCGCCLSDIVQMASVNPAEQYRLKKGKLEIGYDADIIITDAHLDSIQVYNLQ